MLQQTYSVRFSVRFFREKNNFLNSITLNPTLIYRKGIGSLWGRLEKLEAIKLKPSEKSIVYKCAKIIANISRISENTTYKRIIPKTDEELIVVKNLYEKIHNKSIQELLKPMVFCEIFLNWKPLSYQLALLNDESRQIVIRWARQSGKTTTFAAKSLYFCITKPNSQALITSPGLRQSMIVSDKIEEIINKMNPVAKRAWIKKIQRQTISFHNGSKVKVLPYALHRLRGETCDLIFVDEASFIKDDETLFDNILKPMLATRWNRGAQIIVSSTPWGKNTMFYRFCKDPQIAKDWNQHHITWRASVQEGLIPLEFVEMQKRSISIERFQREYEAEFVEDSDSYLTQDLIAKCQDSELDYWAFDYFVSNKELYAGIDLGKKQDYSVIAVIEKDNDLLKLRHLKRFDLETPYASIIGYMKIISERWQRFYKICVDQSGVGEYIVEDMVNAGIPNVEGVVLTMPKKEEVLGYLKQIMLESKLRLPYDQDLIFEMNIEKYEITKDGHIKFSHPEQSHDDRLWALALAVYASRGKESLGTITPIY